MIDGSPRRLPPPRSRSSAALCFSLATGLLLSAAVPALAADKPETPITESCSGPVNDGAQKLCGTLNPHSSAKVTAYFAYNTGANCTGGSRAPAGPEVEGQDIAVSGEATALQAATEYTYCLVATNAAGETLGQPLSFTTAAAGLPSPTPITETCLLLCAALLPGPPSLPTVAGFSNSTAPKTLTAARKLARALRRCRNGPKHHRAGCERRAYKTYRGPHKKHATRPDIAKKHK